MARFSAKKNIFLCFQVSRPAMRTVQPFGEWLTEALPLCKHVWV